MNLNQDMFAVKICELEKQYELMQSRLELCRRENHGEIRRELDRMLAEYKEAEALLEHRERNSRSPGAAALSGIWLDYFRQADQIVKKDLPRSLHSELSDEAQDKAVAGALYAEYAIDVAVQSMRYALIAVMKAIDAQMDCDEKKEAEKNE